MEKTKTATRSERSNQLTDQNENSKANDLCLISGDVDLLQSPASKWNVSMPVQVWEVIRMQAASLKRKDAQVDRLLDILEMCMDEEHEAHEKTIIHPAVLEQRRKQKN